MRFLFAGVLASLCSAAALAHFVYVVPAKDGSTVQVVFSESLEPDENVSIDKIASLKLTARNGSDPDSVVASKKGENALTATAPAKTKLLFGSITYGLLTRQDAKPTLLVYHPKAMLADCDAKTAALGASAPIEIMLVKTGDKSVFAVHASGNPVAEVEVTVLLPNGEKSKLKTNKNGQTDALTQSGRYGAWVRLVEPKAGEHAGKKYEEIRHYATFVVYVK